jgi:transglutaminase-like putative cysteine protease
MNAEAVYARQVRRSPGVLVRLFPWRDGITIFIVLVTSMTVVVSIEAGEWVDGLPSLYPIALFGIASGYLMARIPWRTGFIYPLALLTGASGLLVQVLAVTPGDDLKARCGEMVLRMHIWFRALFSGGISNDSYPAIIVFLVIVWVIVFFLTWSVFRWHNPFIGLVPGGLALLINISYLPGQTSPAFVIFIIAAILLVGRTSLNKQTEEWRKTGTEYPGSLHFFALHQTVWAALILVAAAWLIPVAGRAGPLPSLWRTWTNPIADEFTGLSRVFTAVQGKKGLPLDRYASFLPYRGYFEAMSDDIMMVQTSRPVLLRAGVYGVYTSEGWKAGDRDAQPLDVDPNDLQSTLDEAANHYRQPVAIEVTVQQSLPVFVTPGEPLVVDQKAKAETAGDPSNVIDLRPVEHLKAGDTYNAVGLVSTAPEEALAASGMPVTLFPGEDDPFSDLRGDYPSWVTDRYLALPANLPSSIKTLAENLTEGYQLNEEPPYYKAKALEEYLRTYPLEASDEAPPSGTDAVAYFLFDKQRGNVLYHASAMVVLLRELGVPSRLAVGFSLPEKDVSGEGIYKIEAKDAYAWPEVYFVGLGWIPFDPSPTYGVSQGLTSPEETWDRYFGSNPSTEDILGMFPGNNSSENPAEQNPAAPDTTTQGSSGPPWPAFLIGAVALAATVLAAGLAFAWNRGLDSLSKPARIFEKTRRLSLLAGIGPRPSETPREFLLNLNDEMDERTNVLVLADAYERVEFGHRTTTEEDDTRLEILWKDVRARLVRRVFWRWS